MSPDEVVHSDPEILGGIPVFAGTRVPVLTLIDHLEAGDTIEQFLHSYPSVSREQAVAARKMFEVGTLKDMVVSIALVAPPMCVLLFLSWVVYKGGMGSADAQGCVYSLGSLFVPVFWLIVAATLVIKRFGPVGRAKRKKARQLDALRKIEAGRRTGKSEKDPAQIENERLSNEQMEIGKKKQEAVEKKLLEKCKHIISELGHSQAYSDDKLKINSEYTSEGNRFCITSMDQEDQRTDPLFECLEATGSGHYYETTSWDPNGRGGFTRSTSVERSPGYSHVTIIGYKAGDWENYFGKLVKLASERKRIARKEMDEKWREQERKKHEEEKARFGL